MNQYTFEVKLTYGKRHTSKSVLARTYAQARNDVRKDVTVSQVIGVISIATANSTIIEYPLLPSSFDLE